MILQNTNKIDTQKTIYVYNKPSRISETWLFSSINQEVTYSFDICKSMSREKDEQPECEGKPFILVAFLDAHGGFDLMTVNEAQTMWVLYFCGYSLMVTLDAHGGVPAQASRRIY
jgi:hypothetical protein